MSNLVFKKPHLKSLTGLRFFAAIYVVLFHHGYALCIFGTNICNLLNYGFVSVSLFFILSGFVLSYVYLDAEAIQSINVKRFWMSRFARIYPLYLLSLILSFPSFASKIGHSSDSLLSPFQSVFSAFLSLFLLQAWTPWTSTIWNTPTWAVSNEAFFYFLFPFIALPIARLSSRKIFLLLSLLWMSTFLLPSICIIVLRTGFSLNQSDLWLPFFAYSPSFNLPQFLIGVCIGILYLRKIVSNSKENFLDIPNILMYIFLFGLSFMLITGILLIVSPVSLRYVFLNNGLLAPLFGISIWYLSNGKGWLLKLIVSPKILLLGEASYAIYLFQNPLLSFMKRIPLINPLDIDMDRILLSENNPLIFLVMFIFVLILFSILATNFIEVPMRRILLNRLN